MSPERDRGGTTCILYMCSLMPILVGASMFFLPNPFQSTFGFLFLAAFLGGILMIVIGSALIPSSNRARRKVTSIYEIAAVRKEVSITEISSETGLDYEFVWKVITDAIISRRLFGYLEDDLFVRDVSGYQRYSNIQGGLSDDD